MPAIEGGCGYDGGRRADYVHARSQDMLAAGRVAAAGSALAAHGVDLSDTASLQLALHGAGIHSLHALDDVAQVATTVSVVTTPPIGKRSIVVCVSVCVCVCVFVDPRSCLQNFTSDFHRFCACYLRPWLGSPLTA